MNEATNKGTEAVATPATPLTDEQIATILAAKPVAVAEGDEVTEDTPTVH